MSDARQRLAGLDHLRAFAIVSVFIYHYRLFANQPLVTAIGEFGWSGVDLFFVLSGFLIASQLFMKYHAGGQIRWAEFYGKRLFRTLPAYFVVLATYFLVPQFIERSALPPWWHFATFTQNLNIDLPGKLAFSHAWSLCVEEHFYLFFPLFCLLLLRPGWTRAGAWLIGGLLAAGAALRAFLWLRLIEPLRDLPATTDVSLYKLAFDPIWARFDGLHRDTPALNVAWYKLIYYPTWTRLDGLLVGVALAALYVFRPKARARAERYANALLAFGIILLVAACMLDHDQRKLAATVLAFPAFSLAYGAVLLSALSPSGLLRFDSRVTRFLAAISYSFYLTHKSIIHLTLRSTQGHLDPDGLLSFAACCATSLLGGAALHYAVERPALRLRDSWLSRRLPAARPNLSGSIG